MFTARSTRILGFLLVISLGMVGISHARIITEFSPPTGPGLGDIVVPQVQTPVSTPSPNNDNANPSDNEVALFKHFGAVGPIYIPFLVQLSGGTTEYFFSETVTNTTGIAWIGYQLELGFGVGDTFYRFDEKPISFSIGLPVFDTTDRDPTPTSTVFSTLSTHTHGNFDIQWSGGIVPPAGTVDFTFSIDTPDDWADHDIYSGFTLRQTPEPIPAPPALILGGLGTSLTLMLKRRIL